MTATVPLSEVAEINPRCDTDGVLATDAVDFFPMAVVDADKTVARASERRALQLVSKSFTSFRDGDVLLAKITPCFENGKIFQASVTTPVAFGSTEFHVVRCGAKLDGRYLVHFLRRQEVRSDGERKMTGSGGQRRVPKHFLESLGIPLPPIPEQRRIAAILDKADALRAKRREALAQLDRLAQSIFVEMFGVYEKGCSQWPTKTLGELASDMKIGLVRSSEEFGEQFKVPYVRMNAIGRRGEFIDELVQRTDVTDDELEEYRLQVGDILFNTRNSKELVGKTAIFREAGDYVYNNNLMRIRFDQRIDPEYAAQSFLTPLLQQELEFRKSGTTSVFAIYARDLNTVPIPVPPIELQRAFAMQMSTLRRARLKMSVQEANANSLFVSLQHRAFRGEL